MSNWIAVIWQAPFTSVQQLALPPGASTSRPWACTGNGATIVGEAGDGGYNTWPVKWNRTSLAVTQLAAIGSVQRAVVCSQDGSIIAGDSVASLDRGRWTGGGTAGTLLQPVAPYNQMNFVPGLRSLSDDGAVLVGRSITGGTQNGLATRWDGITPTGLALPPNLGGSFVWTAGSAIACSADGSVVIANANSANGYGGACYYKGGVLYPLNGPSLGYTQVPEVLFCNHDGSVIWGMSPLDGHTNVSVYWDNLSTMTRPPGDIGFYGTPHQLAGLVPGIAPRSPLWVSETGLIAVGFDIAADGTEHAAKWTGTSVADLGNMLGTDDDAWVNMCSADGSGLAGVGHDADGNQHALYWDAANVLHRLPEPVGTIASEAVGISRDGSLIFGIAYGDDSPGPTPPAGPPVPPRNLVWLEFSDDRGHSYGNPVSQSLGSTGEYDTSLQWLRLGMGRDRIFRISWSSPVKVALQGAWIDVQPGQT